MIKIFENDDFVVDYDKENKRYRVSYFEDYHFKEECWFDEYTEEKKSLQEVLNDIKPISHEDIDLDMVRDYIQACLYKLYCETLFTKEQLDKIVLRGDL